MGELRALCGGTGILTLLFVVSSGGQPGFQSRTIYERPAPATAPVETRIAALIADLSSDAVETRRPARQALLAMGAGIRPQLQWALARVHQQVPEADRLQNGVIAGHHPEIAELTESIDRCDAARRATGSMITLRHSSAPLIDVLRDFAAQVDAPAAISSRPDANFQAWPEGALASIDVNRVDYWNALRVMRRGFGLNPTYSSGGVTFYRAGTRADFPLDAANAVVSGPLWIAPSSATLDGAGGMALSLEVAAEPRVGAGQYVAVNVQTYTDDGGRPILPDGQQTTMAFVYAPIG